MQRGGLWEETWQLQKWGCVDKAIRQGQIKTFGHLYYKCYTETGCLFLFRVQLSDAITNVIIIRYISLSLVIAFLKCHNSYWICKVESQSNIHPSSIIYQPLTLCRVVRCWSLFQSGCRFSWQLEKNKQYYPILVSCMSLDCWVKSEYPHRTHTQTQREHIHSTETPWPSCCGGDIASCSKEKKIWSFVMYFPANSIFLQFALCVGSAIEL